MDSCVLDYSRLSGVRLGHRERALLLAAPTPEVVEAAREADRAHAERLRSKLKEASPRLAGVLPIDESAGMVLIDATDRAERVATLRAARKLHELELIDYRRGRIALTAFGADVVSRHSTELREGKRIRWARHQDIALSTRQAAA